jgi:prevent-host-death family protein
VAVKEIGAFEAKTRLGQLLDWVEAGEEVIITRRRRVVAKLVPPDAPSIDRARARARNAARGLREMRKGVTLGGLKIKDLISEGRL